MSPAGRPQAEPASKAEPFGYIHLTIYVWVSGLILGAAFSLAREIPGWFGAPGSLSIGYAIQGAIGLLLWLAFVPRLLARQVHSLAGTGGLPATIRPARAGWIIAYAVLVIVALHDFATDGKWMGTYMGKQRGHWPTVLFLVSFPFVAWLGVKLSLGGGRIETLAEKEAEAKKPAGPSLHAPDEPSGAVLAHGASRDRALAMLEALDAADDAFVAAFGRGAGDAAVREFLAGGDALIAAVNSGWEIPWGADVPVSLQKNLALCAAAYSDATRIARAPANAEGDELRSKTAAKYAEIGFFGPDALGKVLAVARGARDNAAVEVGAKRRDWATLRTV
ncbi:MAG TPA: hypothetical protein VFV90_11250 [Usitatibacter sp.]|nr:hypothetical protein [Usitatibacter sp.]